MVPVSKRIEFNHDGKVFYYDFNDMQFQHVNSASVMFNLINEQKAAPPKSDKQIEQSGMLESETRALAYLLLKEDGKYTYSENLEFLRSLKGSDNYKKIQEMRKDFFDAASIVDAGLLMPYKNLLTAFGSLSSEQIKTLQSQQEKSENVNKSDLNVSISPENLVED